MHQKCSNFHFFLSLLSSLMYSNEKKNFEREKKKTATIRNICIWMVAEKVLGEQGRAQRVTNLIPSSNQSMCTGMTDAKEKRLYEHLCRMIVQDLLNKIKDMNEWTLTLIWPCVRVYNRWEPQGHLSCHTNMPNFFFSIFFS